MDLPLGVLGQQTVSKKAIKGVEILTYIRMMESALNELIAEINLDQESYYRLTLVDGQASVKISKNKYRQNLHKLARFVEYYLDWNELQKLKYVDVRFKDQLIIRRKES
ncbi:MAG: hypothetical protein GF313_10305 [Caldithrix sp.]|nr:hypothetical protein [Caldithrix sp.]